MVTPRWRHEGCWALGRLGPWHALPAGKHSFHIGLSQPPCSTVITWLLGQMPSHPSRNRTSCSINQLQGARNGSWLFSVVRTFSAVLVPGWWGHVHCRGVSLGPRPLSFPLPIPASLGGGPFILCAKQMESNALEENQQKVGGHMNTKQLVLWALLTRYPICKGNLHTDERKAI